MFINFIVIDHPLQKNIGHKSYRYILYGNSLLILMDLLLKENIGHNSYTYILYENSLLILPLNSKYLVLDSQII